MATKTETTAAERRETHREVAHQLLTRTGAHPSAFTELAHLLDAVRDAYDDTETLVAAVVEFAGKRTIVCDTHKVVYVKQAASAAYAATTRV